MKNGNSFGAAQDGANAFIKVICYNDQPNEGYDTRNLFQIEYIESARLFQQEHIETRLVKASDREQFTNAFRSAKSEGALGICIAADYLPTEYLSGLSTELPYIVNDNELLDGNYDIVNLSNGKMIFDGMRYLEANGHRNVVYLSNSLRHYNFMERRRYFLRYRAEHADKLDSAEVVEVGSTPDVICDAVVKLLKKKSKLPDVLFMENFVISMGTINAIQKLGLSVPDDISLIGIDALPETAIQSFELTYFNIPHRERSQLTVHQLLYRINQKNMLTPTETRITGKLRVGETVKIK